MKSRSRVIVTLLWVCLVGTSAHAADPTAGFADLIVVNGHILTVDPANHVVEAIAVRGGRILALGSNAQIYARAMPGARVIDLKGRTATPGLIDAHAHIADGGRSMVYELRLSDAHSIQELKRLVKARAITLKPGEWLVGSGWDEGKLSARRYVYAADLDAVAPRNPVWLLNATAHYGVANSAALKVAGIDASTPNPAAGTIDRTADGQPTGVLKEGAMGLILTHVPKPSPEQWQKGIEASLELMRREGMTGVKDPDISAAEWDAYLALARSGQLTAHVCTLRHTDPTLNSVRANIAWLATLPKPPAAAADNLVSCGVKMYMDGSAAARTAWVYKDWYINGTEVDRGNVGYPAWDPATYQQAVELYTSAGVNIGTHAIGDRAIDWVVDSYAEALGKNPVRGLRHSIIHANIPTDHAISVMAGLQRDYDAGYPEAQAEFIWWLGDTLAGTLGPERLGRLSPNKTYLRRGIQFAGGSDFDVTPLAARYGLWATLARTTIKGTYGATPFGTAEAVDAMTALRSYTTWAAHQLFLDTEAGSLEPGKSADIAVWDRDPTAVPTAELRDIRCLMTLFRGNVVFRAE
jgi:predicted amidohydrolase YtcJ